MNFNSSADDHDELVSTILALRDVSRALGLERHYAVAMFTLPFMTERRVCTAILLLSLS